MQVCYALSGVPETNYLDEGIESNMAKKVLQFLIPTSVQGTRQFLGIMSYCRGFIPGFSKIVTHFMH